MWRTKLPTLVHAYNDAVRGATLPGCTQVEHGHGASNDVKRMADRGVYFDLQAGVLMETYIQFKDRFAHYNSFSILKLGELARSSTTLEGMAGIGTVSEHRSTLYSIPAGLIVINSGVLAAMEIG